jgi:hypothetical protein
MAGFSWTHTFWLAKGRDGTFTLTTEQSALDGDCLDVPPSEGLASGVDVYRALIAMLDELGYDLDRVDLQTVADEIEHLAPAAAEQFRTAPEVIEEIEELERERAALYRHTALAPFAAAIEKYVAHFSDEKLYYPGAGYVYPSRRHWMRCFMEEYVLAHGALPNGKHLITVQGYSGGEHDFPNL